MPKTFRSLVTVAALFQILVRMGIKDETAWRHLLTIRPGGPDPVEDDDALLSITLEIDPSPIMEKQR